MTSWSYPHRLSLISPVNFTAASSQMWALQFTRMSLWLQQQLLLFVQLNSVKNFPPCCRSVHNKGGNFSLFEILDSKNRPPPNCLKLRFWAFQNILRLDFFENFPKSEKFPPLFSIGTQQGGKVYDYQLRTQPKSETLRHSDSNRQTLSRDVPVLGTTFAYFLLSTRV